MHTVAKVSKRAEERNFSWLLDFDITDSVLEELMFPKDKLAVNKRMSILTVRRHIVVGVIIPGLSEPPVRTLRATIPENESHIFR